MVFAGGAEWVSRIPTRKLDKSCTPAGSSDKTWRGATRLRGLACPVVQESLCVCSLLSFLHVPLLPVAVSCLLVKGELAVRPAASVGQSWTASPFCKTVCCGAVHVALTPVAHVFGLLSACCHLMGDAYLACCQKVLSGCRCVRVLLGGECWQCVQYAHAAGASWVFMER